MKKVILYFVSLFMILSLISCVSNLNNTSQSDDFVLHNSSNTNTFNSYIEETDELKDEIPSTDFSEISLEDETTIIDESNNNESIAEESITEESVIPPIESEITPPEEPIKSGTKFVKGDFYMMYQTDPLYNDLPYGINTIGGYGCGPATMAVIVKTLKGDDVTPLTMCNWSFENGYYAKNIGSYHALIPAVAKKWNLDYKTFYTYDKDFIKNTLESGHLILVVMGPGTFTRSGHFMILRGIDENGQLIIADTQSPEKTSKTWDFDFIYNELKKGSPLSIFK